MAVAGFDWLVIDLEHGVGSERELLAQLQAVEHTGIATLVRVEAIERPRFLRVLDLGATGVLVPRLETVADARRAVEYCRYQGSRGVARYNRNWHWGLAPRSLAEADEEVVCAVQIETRGALQAVNEIAAIDGVDVLFVGPADLAHSLGVAGGPDHPGLKERIVEVGAAASAQGKAAGIFLTTFEQAEAYAQLGFTFVACSSDSGLLAREASQLAQRLQGLKKAPLTSTADAEGTQR
ncbi:MAG TPA: aldolase/citrate lyase family protein [Dehalococcoidia bacterium]|jgi:2-dehydro-3-deoxyglucarate aldolase/4-hydroxy-2-oxoheptanedioate aldolase